MIACGTCDLAAVDELALVVVAELDVLGLAERLERVVAALDLAVGDTCAHEVTDSDDDQEDPEQSHWLLEHDNPFIWISNHFGCEGFVKSFTDSGTQWCWVLRHAVRGFGPPSPGPIGCGSPSVGTFGPGDRELRACRSVKRSGPPVTRYGHVRSSRSHHHQLELCPDDRSDRRPGVGTPRRSQADPSLRRRGRSRRGSLG